jgi:hypothetical protein
MAGVRIVAITLPERSKTAQTFPHLADSPAEALAKIGGSGKMN